MGTPDGAPDAIDDGHKIRTGAAIAREFAMRGAPVMIGGQTEATLERTRDHIRQAGGRGEISISDVTKPDVVDELVAKAVASRLDRADPNALDSLCSLDHAEPGDRRPALLMSAAHASRRRGFLVIEAYSVASLIEGIAPYATYLEYKVMPIADVSEASQPSLYRQFRPKTVGLRPLLQRTEKAKADRRGGLKFRAS